MFFYLAVLTKILIFPFFALTLPVLVLGSKFTTGLKINFQSRKIYILSLLSIPLVWQFFEAAYVSKSIYQFVCYFVLLNIFIAAVFYKKGVQVKNLILLFLFSSVGLSVGYLFNFFWYNPKNNNIILSFVSHSRRFSTSWSDQNDFSPSSIKALSMNFLLSILSKFDLAWLTWTPSLFLLYLVFVSIVFVNKKRFEHYILFICLFTCFLVESLIRMRSGMKEIYFFEKINYQYVVYYKIYAQFFIFLSLAMCVRFILEKYSERKLLMYSIVPTVLFSLFMISVTSSRLKNDNFRFIYFRQGPQNICASTKKQSPYLYSFLIDDRNDCREDAAKYEPTSMSN